MSNSLFNLNTALESIGIREQILSSISNFEPRVNNVDANVTIGADSNDMFITVEYDIIGLPVPTQSVDVLLSPQTIIIFGQYLNLDFDDIKTSIRDYLRKRIRILLTMILRDLTSRSLLISI